MKEKFTVILLSDVLDFLDALDENAREKIIYNIRKAKMINDNELFKKLTDNIWEFRTLYNRTYYRLLAFWDKTENTQSIVIATNGFIKKSGKVPLSEINRSEEIRKNYFTQKTNGKK